VQVTPANVHDSQVLGQLLHGQEEEVHGDKAYVGQEATIRQKAPKARNCILQRASRGHPLSAWQKKWNQLQNAIRAKVEHVFGTLKHRFGWRKVRFRGLVKNAEYAYAAAACVNIYHHRRRLLEYLGKSLGRAGAAFCFG
jgi:IS5 family transposase